MYNSDIKTQGLSRKTFRKFQKPFYQGKKNHFIYLLNYFDHFPTVLDVPTMMIPVEKALQ